MANIVVVGDLMLDQYWFGDATRISPEAPVPVVLVKKIDNRIGGAGNVAANIAALGGNVKLFGCIGIDAAANILTDLLAKHNIEYCLTELTEVPTTTKIRAISNQQQLIRLDIEQSAVNVIGQINVPPRPSNNINLLAAVNERLATTNTAKTAQVVLLSDYAKGVLAEPQQYIKLALQQQAKVVVDPKNKDFSVYNNATVITPNLKEFQAVVGVCHDETEIVTRGRNLLQQHNIETLLLTRGAGGMLLLQAHNSPSYIPAKSAEVYDVTGAGDTVVAVIAAALAVNIPIHRAAYLAAVAAGIVVSKVGTSTITLPELQRACAKYDDIKPDYVNADYINSVPTGVISEAELIPIIQRLQLNGEKIVFTNGCYDILHHGHINYLTDAKKLGDRLVVGVNSDESVAALKGPARPVNSLAQRMAVLAGLRAVTWVVPFSEATPGRLVEALAPDVLVKTAENFQTVADIPATEGVAAVLAKGGEVHLVPRTDGVSSTAILQRELAG